MAGCAACIYCIGIICIYVQVWWRPHTSSKFFMLRTHIHTHKHTYTHWFFTCLPPPVCADTCCSTANNDGTPTGGSAAYTRVRLQRCRYRGMHTQGYHTLGTRYLCWYLHTFDIAWIIRFPLRRCASRPRARACVRSFHSVMKNPPENRPNADK